MIPEFLQPILSVKTEELKKQEEEQEQDPDSESESDSSEEEIETPLAIPAKSTIRIEEESCSKNFSSLSHSFNSNCVKYYSKH